MCNNINIVPKNIENTYYANDPLFRDKYGFINDYDEEFDSNDDNQSKESDFSENSITLSSIGDTFGPIKPITPITPINPIPTTYSGGLQSPYFNQKIFVKNYFENLYSNFPTNNVENCGYVAISMLLQYYDAYWNSNFIDDKYNVNSCTIDSKSDVLFDSVGIQDIYCDLWTSEYPQVYETDTEANKKRTLAYINYINNMINNGSFIGYLYKIATETRTEDENKFCLDLNAEIVNTGVNFNVVSGVLAEYINRNSYINQYVHSYAKKLADFNDDQVNLRNAIISKIKNGQPVIVGGRHVNGGGHVTLAYYYDEDNDILYGHSGWKNSSFSNHNNSFCSLDSLFESYSDFYYIDIDLGLNHTHNKYFKLNGTNYCNCELSSHECSYYPFSYGDKNYHVLQCLCNNKYEKHSFISLTSDTKQCKICEYMVSTPSKEVN